MIVELQTRQILTDDEHQVIMNKFPEKLHPFLEKVNNPLDETEILVTLFREKNIRIVLRKENNDFGDLDYVSYFHANDICKTISYDTKHMTDWRNRWNIKLISYKDLTDKSDVYLISNINSKIDHKALFLNEQDLKIILMKVRSSDAKIFQEWLRKQSTIMKAIFKYLLQIKHKNKSRDNINNMTQNLLIDKSVRAVELFKTPMRTKGQIYIATSPEYQQMSMYKIGYAIPSQSKRESTMQTLCPNIKIVYKIDVRDANLAESLIHAYMYHLHANKEFFYVSSIDIAKNIVNKCVNVVNSLVDTFDGDCEILRKFYIGDIGVDLDTNALFEENVKLNFTELYKSDDDKSDVINKLIKIRLCTKYNPIMQCIDDKFLAKKYIIHKLFKLENNEIDRIFLLNWLDKEFLLENCLFYSNKLDITDSIRSAKMHKRTEYVDILLNLFGFKHLINDVGSYIIKTHNIEKQLRESNFLNLDIYNSIMKCFDKHEYVENNNIKFSIKKMVTLANFIFGEYGIGLTVKTKKLKDENRYETCYYLIEIHAGIIDMCSRYIPML